jgi:hypothetical protein
VTIELHCIPILYTVFKFFELLMITMNSENLPDFRGNSLPRRLRVPFVTLAAAFWAGCLAVQVAWAQAPNLIFVTPADGETGVGLGASMVFEFDQPMDTSVSVVPSVPPFLAGNFEVTGAGSFAFFMGTWSEDGRTLTCQPLSEYPENSTVRWTLNPAGGSEPFTSEGGTPLATVSGSFTTTGGGGGGDENCDGLPDTWGGYTVFKGAAYTQTSTADPVPENAAAFYFGANVMGPDSGPAITAASIRLPDASILQLDGLFGMYFYGAEADTEAALDTTYPAGGYELRFTQTGMPERVIAMTMPANNVPVPKVQNYADMLNVNPALDRMVEWNAFTGAGADDYLSITVYEEGTGEIVFQAPDFCVPRELPVTATSVVIPAGTLALARVYSADLTFSKSFYFSTNTVPEMAGFGGLSRSTSFTITTGSGGGTADPADLSAVRVLENGNPGFQLTGTAAQTYRIERSGELSPAASWSVVGTVTLDQAGQGFFEDDSAGKTYPLFYRSVAD